MLFSAFMVGVDLRNSVAFFLFSVDLMLLLGVFAFWLLFDRFRFACLVCLLQSCLLCACLQLLVIVDYGCFVVVCLIDCFDNSVALKMVVLLICFSFFCYDNFAFYICFVDGCLVI